MNKNPAVNIPIESLNFICRTCLIYTESGKFYINDINWENVNLKEVLHIWASVEVEDNDEMPKNMCKFCITKMYEIHRFLSMCNESESVLKHILIQTVSKTCEIKNENDILFENDMIPSSGENNSDVIEIDAEYLPYVNEVEHADVCDEIGSSGENNSEVIENDAEYLPYINEVENADGCDEIGMKDFEPEELKSSEKNPNNKLISTIQSIKKEIKQIHIENRHRIRRLQKAQLVSINDAPKPKWPYVKSKRGPPFTCRTCHASFQTFDNLKSHEAETKHKGSRKFACPYCEKTSHSYSNFLEHYRTHTGEKPNKCTICGKGFNFKSDLKRHTITHFKVKPYNCQLCNKGFTRRQYLNDHERKHTGERLICSFCGKGFQHSSALSTHERGHKGPPGCIRDGDPMSADIIFKCNVCDKMLSSEQTFRAHVMLHGPKNFSCEKCGKTYISQYRLKQHIKFAHNSNPNNNKDHEFPCRLCGNVYKEKSYLAFHMKWHAGENVYPCDLCDKRFARSASLFQHRRIHTGDTKYQCKECSQICTTKRNLEQHMRTHTGEKPFKCEYCNRSFAIKGNLAAHKKIHGEKKHLCPVCGKGFYNGRSAKKHMSLHEKVTLK